MRPDNLQLISDAASKIKLMPTDTSGRAFSKDIMSLITISGTTHRKKTQIQFNELCQGWGKFKFEQELLPFTQWGVTLIKNNIKIDDSFRYKFIFLLFKCFRKSNKWNVLNAVTYNEIIEKYTAQGDFTTPDGIATKRGAIKNILLTTRPSPLNPLAKLKGRSEQESLVAW